METEQPVDADENFETLPKEKADTKLPFSIENLLADKFEKHEDNLKEDQNIACSSASDSTDYFKAHYYNSEGQNHHFDSDDDDKESTNSEPVDVVSSNTDAQEFSEEKSTDYQQSGIDLQNTYSF